MKDLGRIIGIIVFIAIVLIYLFVFDYYSFLSLGINQFHNIISYQPSFKYYISSNNLILCIINNQNFSIIIYNISGKYIYLPKSQIISPMSIDNISLIITNTTNFNSSINNANCVIHIKLGFLSSNISISQVI